jgi:MoaA/NifB/PqqE/SkfB family radical SAM enzyme
VYLEDHPAYIQHLADSQVLYPSAINIELTTFCNLKCIMCPKTCGIARTPANKRIDPIVLDRILTEVVPHIARIDLVGDGEILLELELLTKVLESANKYNVLVNASTNAVLLDKRASNLFIDSQLHDLNISLDAASPETYQKIRGYDLNKILNNIKILNQLKAEKKSATPRLHFSMVGMDMNISELPALVRLASDYGVESVTLQAMGEFEQVKDQSVYLRNKDIGRKYLHEAQRISEEVHVALDLWPENQFEDTGTGDKSGITESSDEYRKDCNFPWDVPYFATDGTIRPCCAMPPMGSLNDSSFNGIWIGKPYETLREMLKSIHPPHECKMCPGRGWHKPTLPEPFARPGQQDRQFGLGWFESEKDDGGTYKWARKKASVFLKGNKSPVLFMTLQSASESGTTQTVSIQMDQDSQVTATLNPGQRKQIYLQARDPDRDLHHVQLRGDTWRPVDIIPSSRDPREISIKLYEAGMVGTACETRFEHNIDLIGCRFPKSVSVSTALVPIELYARIDTTPSETLRCFVHILQTSGNHGSLNFLLQDIKRKLFQSDTSFQYDGPVHVDAHSPDLIKIDAACPLHDRQSEGVYTVMAGFYHDNGSRLPVAETSLPTYRNGIVLGTIELVR